MSCVPVRRLSNSLPSVLWLAKEGLIAVSGPIYLQSSSYRELMHCLNTYTVLDLSTVLTWRTLHPDREGKGDADTTTAQGGGGVTMAQVDIQDLIHRVVDQSYEGLYSLTKAVGGHKYG